MIAPYIFHDEATAKTLRKNPSFAAEYLNSVLADGNQQELILALRRLAYAFTMKEATDMTLATVTVIQHVTLSSDQTKIATKFDQPFSVYPYW